MCDESPAMSFRLVGLTIVAFALRVAAGAVRYHGTSWWESGYSHYGALARSIAAGEGFRLGSLQAPRPLCTRCCLAPNTTSQATATSCPSSCSPPLGPAP